MITITAPEEAPTFSLTKDWYKVFLAGGITNCPPWQPELIKLLEQYNATNLVLFNPRRDNFDITNNSISAEQIDWEHLMLKKADLVSFWFSQGPSVQPITLYEYGKYSTKNKHNVVVGCHPDYLRSFDLEYQSSLEGIEVCNDLNILASKIIQKQIQWKNDKSN